MKGASATEGGKFEIEGVGEDPTSPFTLVPRPVEPVTAGHVASVVKDRRRKLREQGGVVLGGFELIRADQPEVTRPHPRHLFR